MNMDIDQEATKPHSSGWGVASGLGRTAVAICRRGSTAPGQSGDGRVDTVVHARTVPHASLVVCAREHRGLRRTLLSPIDPSPRVTLILMIMLVNSVYLSESLGFERPSQAS
jgi:hypothetical protein